MTADTRTGLHLTLAHDAGALASELAGSLLRPVDDPFAQPLVLVPGSALQRWLSQRVATASPRGIRAGVEFARPGRLGPLVAGHDPGDDPWSPERLVWAILQVAAAAPAGLEPLVRNLDASEQRVANARRVARLLARYARYRPAMLADWSAADDVGGLDLGFDLWQAVLWRALHEVVPGPDPVERHEELVVGVRTGAVAVPWPAVSVFQPRRLAPADLDLLAALATRVRVDAYVTTPAPGLAEAVAPRLGRRGAEVVAGLRSVAASVTELPGHGRPAVLQAHASHGPDRQVEVLREVLTGLFADDPTLEPRDVAVACPDVAALTPHLRSAFAPADRPEGWQHPGTGLRVQVADHAGATANRLAALVRTVASLGVGRATASELLALASHPFVARRFGFRPDDLERLGELVPQAAIRWGLDAGHRSRTGLATVQQGTWQVGVQRLLVGEALADDELAALGRIATVDDVESTDVPRIGALAELVTRASRLARECLQPAPVATWVARFRAIVDQVAEVPFDESWQVAQLWSALDRVERAATGADTLLGTWEAVDLVDLELAGSGTRPAFGNGSLVVGGLDELATVPHRVLCVVGLDERSFPRRGVGDGDDLLRGEPRPGDPDPGADDRQLLLDTLGSARDRLVVVYHGHSSLTHEEHHPPAGLVDLLEASGTAVVHEALQPFSPGYFAGEQTGFDRAALRAAEALTGPRSDPDDPFAVGYLPLPEPVVTLELDALRQFVRHPGRFFLRHRAGLSLGDDDPVADDLPIELDGLQRWQVGARLLDEVVAGHAPDRVATQEWLRGDLPPGELGRRVLEGVQATASQVLAARAPWVQEPAQFHSIDLEVGGLRLTGRAATHGNITLTTGFSSVAAKHLAPAWLDALALTVQLGRRIDAVVIGGRRRHRLVAPPPDLARHLLGQVADLAVEGLQRVLPMPPRVCRLWAGARAVGNDPVADQGLKGAWRQERDDAWAALLPGGPPWQARVTDQPWAQPGEPTELGSLAALVWAPIVRADV